MGSHGSIWVVLNSCPNIISTSKLHEEQMEVFLKEGYPTLTKRASLRLKPWEKLNFMGQIQFGIFNFNFPIKALLQRRE